MASVCQQTPFGYVLREFFVPTISSLLGDESTTKYSSIRYLLHIAEAEHSLLLHIYNRNKEKLYAELLRRDYIARHLWKGMKKSFDLYFRKNRIEEQQFKKRCLDLFSKIEDLTTSFDD